MVPIVALDEVEHDAATLEEADHLAVGVLVRHGGDAAVGVDVEEPGRQGRGQRRSFWQRKWICCWVYTMIEDVFITIAPSVCSSRCQSW